MYTSRNSILYRLVLIVILVYKHHRNKVAAFCGSLLGVFSVVFSRKTLIWHRCTKCDKLLCSSRTTGVCGSGIMDEGRRKSFSRGEEKFFSCFFEITNNNVGSVWCFRIEDEDVSSEMCDLKSGFPLGSFLLGFCSADHHFSHGI